MIETIARAKGPKFVSLFGPVLDALRELGASARPQEVYDLVARRLMVPDAELDATNQNGRSKFNNRVAWARFYLAKAGLIDSEQRGIWVLTEQGRQTHLEPASAHSLFKTIHAQFKNEDASERDDETFGSPTQVENLSEEPSAPASDGYINGDSIRGDLTELLKKLSAKGFEELCARILRHIGFENVVTTGGRGDRGVDGEGYLLLNRFVKTKVFFQCKRYYDTVGPDKIRDFRGAIHGRADRGIFLTTGTFTREARVEASRENAVPIELVDIERLIEIMIEEKLGLEEKKALSLNDKFFEVYR